jgi:glycine/D-amino acid oxidase-like deaminating enzyme
LPSARDVEVAIIGAGAVGAACAAAVSRAGRDVTVLRHPGRGTTPVSGGHLLLQSKRPGPALELAWRSLELVAELAQGREETLGYRHSGSLITARSEGALKALQVHHQALRDTGVPVQWLSPEQVRALEPSLSGQVIGASYCPLDAQIRPDRLAAVYLDQAVEHGATVRSAPVDAIRRPSAPGGRFLVRSRGEDLHARLVVLAAGPWSASIGALLGVTLEIRPRRGVLLRSRTEREVAARPLLGAEYLEAKFGETEQGIAFSFQQHPDGECVLGGSREFVGWDETGVEPLREKILELGNAYLPDLRRLPWRATSVGYRPWTPSGQPYLGKCAVPGVLLACGFEGDGITLAAGAAEQIAVGVEEALGS